MEGVSQSFPAAYSQNTDSKRTFALIGVTRHMYGHASLSRSSSGKLHTTWIYLKLLNNLNLLKKIVHK